ncbi:MAG TPA: DUF3592 domain-containing protein [Streptosporangiaceae bacterium]|jgi:hypothetical protein
MWIVVLVSLAGVVAAATGVVMLVRTRRFLEGSQLTEGTIVGWREESFSASDGGDTALYPILRFQVPDGRAIETEAQMPVSSRPDPDAAVAVLYDPADPRRARLATHGGRGYLTGVVFVICGIGLAVLPYVFF